MTTVDLAALEEGEVSEGVIDLTSAESVVPIEEVSYKAAIATLASKRIKGEGNSGAEFEKYSAYLQNGMEDQIRVELASEVMSAKLKRMKEMQATSLEAGQKEITEGLLDLELGYNVQQEKLTVIEKNAAAEVVDQGLTSPSRLNVAEDETDKELFDEGYISLETTFEDSMAKQMMLAKEMGEVAEGLGVNLETITDLGYMIIPGGHEAMLDQNIKTTLDKFWPGSDIQEQKSKFDTLTIEEQHTEIQRIKETFEGDPLSALIVLSYLNNITTFDIWAENIGAGIDLAVVGGSAAVKGIYMAGKTLNIFNSLRKSRLATAALEVGNSESAVSHTLQVEEGVRKGDIAYDSQEAIEAGELLLDGGVTPFKDLSSDVVVNSEKLRTRIESIVEASEDFLASPQARLLTTEERAEMLADLKVQYIDLRQTQGYRHVDIQPGDKSLSVAYKNGKQWDDIQEDIYGVRYDIYYGTEKGNGFKSLKNAQKHSDYLKLDNATVTPIEANGEHFLRVSVRADQQNGFVQPYDLTKMHSGNPLQRFLLSTTNIVGTISARAAHLSVASRETAIAHAKKLEKIKYKVKGKKAEQLDSVIHLGTVEQDGIWYSAKTLQERFRLDADQIAAYKAFQAQEDLYHILDNSSVYTRRATAGHKTIELKVPIEGLERFIGKPVDHIDNPSNKQIFDVSNKKFITIKDKEELEAVQRNGYKIIELEGAQESELIQPVQFVLMKEADGTINPLDLMQVVYRPGGRVRYEDSHFLKLGRVRPGPGKTQVIMRSLTLGVGSAEDVKEAARVYTEAAKVWARKGSNSEMAEVTGGRFQNLQTFEDVVGSKNLASMRVNPELAFEAVQDGEALSSVNKLVAAGKSRYLAEDINELNTLQRMIAINGSHRSRRGARLSHIGSDRMKDFTYNTTPPIVSPREVASESISRAARIMSIDKYHHRNVQQWYTTFGAVLDQQTGVRHTPLGWLLRDDKDKYLDYNKASKEQKFLIDKARAMEQHIKKVMGTPSKEDIVRERMFGWLVSKLEPNLKKMGVTENYLEELKTADPAKAFRAFMFDTKLGLGNPTQPAIQLQSSAVMVTIDPVNGVEAVLSTPLLFAALMSENPKTIGTIARRMMDMFPETKAAHFKEGLEVLKRSGNWRLTGGSLQEQDFRNLTPSTWFSKLLEIGRAPFINAERFNKIAATYSAYLKWRKANPKAKVTDDIVDTVRTRGEDMAQSMGRIDSARWGDGVLGAITQFYSYQARMIEAFAPSMMGGKKSFSNGEKASIFFNQLAMHGVGGTLGVGPGRRFRTAIQEEYERHYGEMDETFLNTVEKGYISGLLGAALLGTDQVNFYARAGLSLLDSGPSGLLWKAFTQGDLSQLVEFPAVDVFSDIIPEFVDVIKLFSPVDPRVDMMGLPTMLEATKTIFTKHIATLGTTDKTLWALQHGQFLDKNGSVTDNDVSVRRAFAKLLGVDTSAATQTRAMKEVAKGFQDNETKTSQALSSMFREVLANELPAEEWHKLALPYLIRHDQDRWDAIYSSALSKVTRDPKFDAEKLIQKYVRLPQPVSTEN
jgi:hypothetical protein